VATGTIACVSSPPGGGARAVLRLSGPDAGRLIAERFTAVDGAAPEVPVRGVYRGRFEDGGGSVPCLWFWMPGPASFTREDVSELHIPGSPPLVEAALLCLLQAGARLAEPGEFTRRAFENGRIDLTRAEGVLGMIEAADVAATRSAAALLFGGLSERVEALRSGLDSLRALTEASLDFDSTETGHVDTTALVERADQLALELGEALAWESRRRSSHGRPRIVLAGRPNAGKSSLFNALTQAVAADAAGHAALVSDFAGSTRDGKAALWLVAGVELELFDAPGFEFGARGENDPSARAQILAERARRGADVILWTVPVSNSGGADADADADAVAADFKLLPTDAVVLPIATKSDLGGLAQFPPGLPAALSVSAVAAPDAARTILETHVARALGLTEAPAVEVAASLGRELSARHRAALALGLEALGEARSGLETGLPLDLVAETLRAATDELDGISGKTTPEDLLDRIFSGFCLGK